jgi:hypothetical protein
VSNFGAELTHHLVREICDRPTRAEWPIDKVSAACLLLSGELRSKSWRIVTGHGVFESDRLPEHWTTPGSDGPWLAGRALPPIERVYQLTRIRIDPSTDDYTAFYDLETTRSA